MLTINEEEQIFQNCPDHPDGPITYKYVENVILIEQEDAI